MEPELERQQQQTEATIQPLKQQTINFINSKMQQNHSEGSQNSSQTDAFFACFTYSPNWFTEQSICILSDVEMMYASNHLLYTYDIRLRRVSRELSPKMIMRQWMKKHKNHDITEGQMGTLKLFCIVKTDQHYILGLNDGIIVILDLKLECRLVYRIKIKNILNILAWEENDVTCIVVFDEVGCSVKAQFQNYEVIRLQIKIESDDTHNRLKKVVFLNKMAYCFYQRGTVHVIDEKFSENSRKLVFSKNQSILSVSAQANKVILLTREKDNLCLCYFKIEDKFQFALEHTKTIREITKEVYRCQITMEYPKKYNYRKDEIKKAAMSVCWLEDRRFMLTGKLAEIYIMDLMKAPKGGSLQLKPFSIEEDNPSYQTLPESKHYSEIYQVYRRDDMVITVGTDRNINFWRLTSDGLEHTYLMKFLASQVTSIIPSSCVGFLMSNSVIRTWDPDRQGCQYHLSEYWKAGQKMKFTQAAADRQNEGILSLLTDDNKIVVYDLFEERMIKSIALETLQQCHISYIRQKDVNKICQLFQTELQTVKPECKEYFKRNLTAEYVIMAQLSNSLRLINVKTMEVWSCQKFFKNMEKDEKLTQLYVDDIVITSKISNKEAKIVMWTDKLQQYPLEDKEIRFSHHYAGNCLVLSLYKKKEHRVVVLDKEMKVLKKIELPYTYHIDKVVNCGKYILAYSHVHNGLQVWQMDYQLDGNEHIMAISKNVKAHNGTVTVATIYRNRFVVSCSQDQNIKVWDLNRLEERKPPKSKKSKGKKKDKKESQESEQQVKETK